jgi:anti-anti-sigma factor
MHIHFEKREPFVIARVNGSLTGQSSVDLESEVLNNVRGAPAQVVLNFGDLDYVSSAGIGSVLKLFKELQDRGCGMSIVAAPARIKMLFELAGLTQLVPFRDKEADVLKDGA